MKSDLEDVRLLYKLSLSIGKSLKPEEESKGFIEALSDCFPNGSITVWIRPDNIFRTSRLTCLASIPSCSELAEKDIGPGLLFELFKAKNFTVLPESSILSENNYSTKTVLFKLKNFGVLEICSDVLAEKGEPLLAQLDEVVQKFTISLETCFFHKKQNAEISKKKALEEQVKGIALFPDENPNPVFRVSKFGKLLYANKSSLMIMGHLRIKIGRKISVSLLQRVRKSFDNSEREFVLYVNYRYYSFLVVYIKSANYFNIYGTNVTLQKESEKKLRKSERRYRELVEVANDIICQTDIMGKITYINPIGNKVLKSENNEIVGKNFFQLVHPNQKKEVMQFYKRQIRDKMHSSFLQFQVIDLEGNHLWIEQKVQPLIQEDNLKGFSAIARDVTARVRGDELLRRSEEKLRLVIDNAFDGIITINQQHEITEWNPQAQKIFGYTAEEALGTVFANKLFYDEKSELYMEGLNSFLSKRQKNTLNQRYELQGIRKTSEIFPIELTISPMQIDNKYFFSIFIRDITIEKQSKKELERALRKEIELGEMKSKFVSMTSHEFRTPLTTIRSSIELLTFYIEKEEIKKKDKIIKNLNRINDEISRLTRLMNDILTVGRLDSSRMTYNPSLVDITVIAKNIIDFNFSKQRKVSLQVSGEQRLLSIDENIFTHILTNLISNALKYSPNETLPTVKISFNKKTTKISVKDHGIGIPKEDLKNLFTSFFRASNVGNIQGTGLGLSIVKQFVDMMNGEIQVKSTLNKGSEFVVQLFC